MDKIFNIINCCGKRDEIFINSDINIQTNNLIDNSVIKKKNRRKRKRKINRYKKYIFEFTNKRK